MTRQYSKLAIDPNLTRRLGWMAYDYLLLVACFAGAFGVLSPLHDVELISMIMLPAITVAILARRGAYGLGRDQPLAYALKRLGAASILAVFVWIPVFSTYEIEHTPWSSLPLYEVLALGATLTARRLPWPV